ncbi:MAG: hypothetical protein LBR21_05445, partial [Propionibacteriaceae bacterium]|nr:hypothetical protein [Propionibacteriaceae bacterium]
MNKYKVAKGRGTARKAIGATTAFFLAVTGLISTSATVAEAATSECRARQSCWTQKQRHDYGWRFVSGDYATPIASIGEIAYKTSDTEAKKKANLKSVYFCRDYLDRAPNDDVRPNRNYQQYYIGYSNTVWGGTETRANGNDATIPAIQQKEGAALGWLMWKLASVADFD